MKQFILILFLFTFLIGCAKTPGVSLQEIAPPTTPFLLMEDIIDTLPESQQVFRIESVKAIESELIAALHAARYSYFSELPLESGWQKYEILRPKSIFSLDSTIVLIKVDDPGKTVEIAIRGTATLDDLLKDLNTKAEIDDQLGIPLHSGFHSIAGGVISLIREKFPVEKYPKYIFKLYGHSMGGAVAAIVSMYLHDDGRQVSIVITFGAPRFTTNEGARKYQVLNQRTYRVVRCDDVVPFLPPPDFFGWSTGSYESNGNLLLLLRPPYFDYSIGIDIERDFIHQLRVELSNIIDRENLAFGHRMDNYESLLLYYSSERHISPMHYQLSMQGILCPKRLAE